MPDKPLPLHELSAAVQSAVQRVLAQHGAVPVDKLWVGFVAPESIGNLDTATKLANELNKELPGLSGAPSVAQLAGPAAAGAEHKAAAGSPPIPPRGHIIGLIYSPQLRK